MKHSSKKFLEEIPLPHIALILVYALLSIIGGHVADCIQPETSSSFIHRVAWADEPSEAEIQWFRDEMKISPKYQEDEEGLWGMSWVHFITMVFLILFFIATLVAMYIREKRTKKILTTLLEEE